MASSPLTLYSRRGCHLCDDMIALLRDFQKDYNFSFEIVDIDEDVLLKERFNVLVPVLYIQQQEICHHFLDLKALVTALGETKEAT